MILTCYLIEYKRILGGQTVCYYICHYKSFILNIFISMQKIAICSSKTWMNVLLVTDMSPIVQSNYKILSQFMYFSLKSCHHFWGNKDVQALE